MLKCSSSDCLTVRAPGPVWEMTLTISKMREGRVWPSHVTLDTPGLLQCESDWPGDCNVVAVAPPHISHISPLPSHHILSLTSVQRHRSGYCPHPASLPPSVTLLKTPIYFMKYFCIFPYAGSDEIEVMLTSVRIICILTITICEMLAAHPSC